MTGRLAILSALAVLTCSAGGQPSAKPPEPPAPGFPHPVVVLLRDAAVHEELKLSDGQKKSVRALIAEVDEPLWLLRDFPPQQAWEKARPLAEKVEHGARRLLGEGQQKRFEQILLQALGSAALMRPEGADKLGLSADQRQQLQKLDETVQRELSELQERVKAGREKEGPKKVADIQARLQERRIAVLTEAQKQQWSVLIGKPFDLSRLRPVGVQAPELRDVNAWVNTEALTLTGLRGRVVAIHFWAFG